MTIATDMTDRPYAGAPRLNIERDLYAVVRCTLSPEFVIVNLNGGETVRDGASDAYRLFGDFDFAVETAQRIAQINQDAGCWHDFPSRHAAINWARA